MVRIFQNQCPFNIHRYIVIMMKHCSYSILGLPILAEDVSEEELNDLINTSRLIELPQLETICTNIKNTEACLNTSIAVHLNDEKGKAMKEFFFNQSTFADISFNVQG